ncbi:carboxylate-amine ligase [Aquisphaera insulae]|uniref:carboxylate-amine ligase n=1 Tax=Aquisphaera insulae TaxID=2712864 RepID=UPI0013ECF65A|nr:carboxylate-amine ligase [Aquisphaera insulae]
MAADDFTIGVEEEYQIINPETRELRPRVARVLPKAREDLGDEVTNEFYQSQIEIGTPVCRTLADVRAELVRLRRGVVAAAERDGSRIAAAGTHPFSTWEGQPITPKPRYFELHDDFQQLAREQIIFGCHVHVGIADREEAVQAMNRCRPWLAPIIALSASSPFWLGAETGYASYRTQLFSRWPMTGTPQVFASRAEYDACVASLVAVGMIPDASKIYWDVRLSSHVETLEFRIADVCPTIDEAVMIAGLCRALARSCVEQHRRGLPLEPVRPELLDAARWRASRFGLDGELIDVLAVKSVPARSLIEAMLEFLHPALESSGDWQEVSRLVNRTLEQGNGAKRQLWAFAQGGRLEDVIDLVLGETSRGL